MNTSFKVKDEPIVCIPEDAYRCFMKTQIDVLVLESHLIVKPIADLVVHARMDPEWAMKHS